MSKNATKPLPLSDENPTLHPCIPQDFLWLPKPLRKVFGIITILIFVWSFLTIPTTIIFTLFLLRYRQLSTIASVLYGSLILSLLFPMREWPVMRKVGQLWYELFDFSCNLNPAMLKPFINGSMDGQYIVSMHPHGVIPLQAILWAAYCDQYLQDASTGQSMYGFGAAADIIMYLPFLRNIMGWLSGGSATYSVLKNGLSKVGCLTSLRRVVVRSLKLICFLRELFLVLTRLGDRRGIYTFCLVE